ncbi:MAG: Gfo/Idh/MocA family protein, partial [Pyrinomonadaceae bacterium]
MSERVSTKERIKSATIGFGVIGEIRAGIVGAGLMGRWHADAVKKAGGEVVGVADFDLTKAEALAGKYSNAPAFANVEEMLSEQKIDVLHVCSPTESHADVSEIAINAGVHLLVEKPVAETANATVKLYEMAAKNNTLLCPVHQFVFQNGVEKAKRRLQRIGQIVHVEANICSAGGIGFDGKHLNEIANNILPHPLSLIQKFIETDI